MKSFFHSPLLLTLVSLLFLHTSPLFGQAAAPAKVKKIPFHGKIVALDASAQTITLNGKSARVLHVTPSTKLIDGAGNPTTFSTATVGEDVGGSYNKADMTLFSLRIGAKAGSKEASEESTSPAAEAPAKATTATTPAPAPAPATAATTPDQTAASDAAATTKPSTVKKSHFSGKVTAVDAASSTFTIKTRTFTTTAATKITDSTGAAASLADVAVGAKVSGSYEKSADGATLTVDTLKVTK
jgi:hypothetical protein